ncbi:MAG: Xaa-Pro peptidase family protein [Candidatus Humimicrobiia bacterium]
MDYQIRTDKIREKIIKSKLDGFLIVGENNIRYLSGFFGKGSGSWVLLTKNQQYLLTDSRFTEQANEQAPYYKKYIWERPYIKHFSNLINEIKLKKLGFESNHITYQVFLKINRVIPKVELTPISRWVEEMRTVKSKEEIDLITKAANISDKAFSIIINEIEVGMKERDIANRLDFILRDLGADKESFDTIIASGIMSSMPHATASNKVVEDGDLVKLDFGSIIDGYHSDMTRMVVIGKSNSRQKNIFNIVLEAQTKALSAVRAGIKCKNLDKIARYIITEKGYGENFLHGLGHGVGLDIHESPALTKNSEDILKKGMVITIEPGIYFSDFGGVRIEDLLFVTDDGCEILSKTEKTFYEI